MTDDELEDYLVNWGRWSRESRGPGRSPMARLIAEAGAMSGIFESDSPVDIAKAVQVNRAWQGMPCTTHSDRCIKALIAALYAYPVSREHMLSLIWRHFKLRMRYRDVDNFLTRGRTVIRNRLEKILSIIAQKLYTVSDAKDLLWRSGLFAPRESRRKPGSIEIECGLFALLLKDLS